MVQTSRSSAIAAEDKIQALQAMLAVAEARVEESVYANPPPGALEAAQAKVRLPLGSQRRGIFG